MTPVLIPLYVHPLLDPQAWRAVAALPTPTTVVIESTYRDETIARLARTSVALLGRVDTRFATRPLTEILDDVAQWAAYPVSGVFLDQAPTSPFSLGPLALATRLARRSGLSTVVISPGIATDPLYRELGAQICTFEGSWIQYRRWSREGAYPGDGHLVHSVPLAEFDEAYALLRARGAGWGLVTDRRPPATYAGLPTRLPSRPGPLTGARSPAAR